MDDKLLNVFAVRRRTQTNGPGWRGAVWVQGCTLHCPGCFNPDTHPHQAHRLWRPEQLAAQMMDNDVEGISILGGEPFEQAAACARLAQEAQKLGGSVVTYSGYTWSYLQKAQLPEVHELLNATDLLIAGPYIAALATDGECWHGSSNQEFIFLTGRYDQSIWEQGASSPVVEVWTDGKTFDWSGIPVASPRK